MTRWGLAVTLDRSGDWERAVEEAILADAIEEQQHQMVHSSIDRAGVFFVPEYDRDWYHAIRSVAMAHRATRAIDKLTSWETAAILYQAFLSHAVKTDRWIPLAKSRLKLCELKAAALKSEVRREQLRDAANAFVKPLPDDRLTRPAAARALARSAQLRQRRDPFGARARGLSPLLRRTRRSSPRLAIAGHRG